VNEHGDKNAEQQKGRYMENRLHNQDNQSQAAEQYSRKQFKHDVPPFQINVESILAQI